MGRPEKPVNSHGNPVEEFAMGLRELRRQTGQPSYRELGRRAAYSPATLSRAANGQHLPTRETALAYVRACGGDEALWEQRWTAARTADITGTSPPAGQSRRRPPRHGGTLISLLLTAVCTASLVIAAIRLTGWQHASTPAPAATPAVTPAPVIHDGADPVNSGCADVTSQTLARVSLPPTASQPGGTLELRYSPRCRGGWARFTTAGQWPAAIHLQVGISSSDGRAATFTAPVTDLTLYTDLLLPHSSCLTASATILNGSPSSPRRLTTRCTRPR